jgi:hypothetical protein
MESAPIHFERQFSLCIEEEKTSDHTRNRVVLSVLDELPHLPSQNGAWQVLLYEGENMHLEVRLVLTHKLVAHGRNNVRETLRLTLRESNHNAEVGHAHSSESVQANVRDDLDNVALVGVDPDKVEDQDCVNRSREHLELMLQHHNRGLMDNTQLARQMFKLSGDQFAQGRLSRDTGPRLHDAARDRPLQADIHRTQRHYKRESSVGAEMLAATAEKPELSLACKNFIPMLLNAIFTKCQIVKTEVNRK